MSILLYGIGVFMLLVACENNDPKDQPDLIEDQVGSKDYHNHVRQSLKNEPNGTEVFVMAHRGDWKNVPENSLLGIENCISLGIDIVEVDIRKTKDGKLVLMHDETLDRTTEGTGLVDEYTWEELQNLRLRNPNGSLSDQTIPSLEQALRLAKEKMILFLDKSYDYHNEIHELLVKTETLEQVVVEGIADLPMYQKDYPEVWNRLSFAARIGAGQSEVYIKNHIENNYSNFLFPSCSLMLSAEEKYTLVKESKKWLLLAVSSNTGCSEEFQQNWGWAIDQGIDILITDKPKELLDYLRNKDLHL